MAKFAEKLAEMLGFSAEYEEDEETEEVEIEESIIMEEPREVRKAAPVSDVKPQRKYNFDTYTRGAGGTVTQVKTVNMQANVRVEVVMASPETLKEAKELVKSIRAKKPVVVNLEYVSLEMAQRITDFLTGCNYGLNGNVQRIAEKIFMLAPDNMDFAGDFDFSAFENKEGINFSWSDEKK